MSVYGRLKQWRVMWVVSLSLSLTMASASGGAAADRASADPAKKDMVQKLYRSYKEDFPQVTDISATEAQALLARGAVVFVDVRSPKERAVSMLPGALSEAEFLKTPSLGQGKTIVAYCTIGYRSGVFAKKMAGEGRTVRNLAGGILGWVLDRGKVYHDRKESRRVHVYGKKWNILPEGYTAVTFGSLEKLIH